MRIPPVATLVLVLWASGCGVVKDLVGSPSTVGDPPKGSYTATITGKHNGADFSLTVKGQAGGLDDGAFSLNGPVDGNGKATGPTLQITTQTHLVLGAKPIQKFATLDTSWPGRTSAPAGGGSAQFLFDSISLAPLRVHGTITATFGTTGPEQYTYTNGEYTLYPVCNFTTVGKNVECGGLISSPPPLPITMKVIVPPEPNTMENFDRCPPELEAVFLDPATASAAAGLLTSALVYDGNTLRSGTATALDCEKLDFIDATSSHRCAAQKTGVTSGACAWTVTAIAAPTVGPSGHLTLTAAADASCAAPARFCGAQYAVQAVR